MSNDRQLSYVWNHLGRNYNELRPIKSDKRPQSSRSQQWGRRPGQFAADEKCQILQDPGDHGEICYIRATTKRQLLQSCCGDNIISSWLGRCGGDHWWLKARVPSGHLVSSNLAVENRHLQQVYKSFTRWLSMEGLNRVCHKIADLSPIGTWGKFAPRKSLKSSWRWHWFLAPLVIH